MRTRFPGRLRGVVNGDVMLVAVLGSVLAMIVVPLPSWVLDCAISANLCASFLVLMSAMRSPGPSAFPAFPSVLLITTLLRLSLNISSTRLILNDGAAGRVIEAFGRFAAGGNFVVGGIVFVIITVIQFIVIAKGSERVAEVAARFNLDAMPGKQMSIDAELRAGGIDQAEAQRRRQVLEQESQFFGAMDGAMKFVKGDAIAGIIIAVVNVAGGFAVGVLQRGMDAEQAAATYALLSIGDGLVSQIPSLLVSIAAGILVTRVHTAGTQTGLGRQIVTNLAASPWALFATGAVLLLMAAAPGLPAFPFVALAAGAIAAGARARRTSAVGADRSSRAVAASPDAKTTVATVIRLDLGTGIATDTAALTQISEAADRARETIRESFGVRIPGVRIRPAAAPGRSVVVTIADTPIITAEAPEADAAAAVERTVEAALAGHLADFIGIQDAHDLVEGLALACPALVKETVPKIIGYPRLADLLRRLVEERIPITDLRNILEAVAACGPVDTPAVLVETVRAALRRQICASAKGNRETLPVMLVDRSIEGAITDSVAESGGVQCLTLRPEAARAIIVCIKEEVAKARAGGVAPALVTEPACRKFLRKIIETELPEVPVISYHELAPEVRVEAVGKVSLAA